MIPTFVWSLTICKIFWHTNVYEGVEHFQE